MRIASLPARTTTNAEPMHDSIKYRDDYIGLRFGKAVVIAYPATKKGLRGGGLVCKCDCGQVFFVSNTKAFLNGEKTQCPLCSRKDHTELLRYRWRVDPLKRSCYYEFRDERLYHVWLGMKHRCGKHRGYEDVEICSEWQDYRVFREWAYSHGYDEDAPKGQCTIDRINPFGNYEPSNCRFTDSKTQALNKRSRWINLDEETREMVMRTSLAY